MTDNSQNSGTAGNVADTLTGVLRAVNRLRELPRDERRGPARALVPRLDAVLTERVEDETTIGAWVKLGRLGGPDAALSVLDIPNITRRDARALALAALGLDVEPAGDPGTHPVPWFDPAAGSVGERQ